MYGFAVGSCWPVAMCTPTYHREWRARKGTQRSSSTWRSSRWSTDGSERIFAQQRAPLAYQSRRSIGASLRESSSVTRMHRSHIWPMQIRRPGLPMLSSRSMSLHSRVAILISSANGIVLISMSNGSIWLKNVGYSISHLMRNIHIKHERASVLSWKWRHGRGGTRAFRSSQEPMVYRKHWDFPAGLQRGSEALIQESPGRNNGDETDRNREQGCHEAIPDWACVPNHSSIVAPEISSQHRIMSH